MIKYFKYHLLKYRIKDPETRVLFEELTSTDYREWNNRYFNDLNNVANNGYSALEGYTKIFLLSHPEIWILLLKDEEFLNYIHSFWKDVLMVLYNDAEENKKFKIIITYLNLNYEKMFPLNLS